MNPTSRGNRVGIYAWAGPGTVRLLETKYWNPTIDRESFFAAYDLPYLTALKKKFGVTDAWVTYSWGFSDEAEQEDYAFWQSKRGNFSKLGIRTHLYVQGLNVVTAEFAHADFYCRDPWGRRISYSKGRSFICPNHPATHQLLARRVNQASLEQTDGVYIDNILFGLPPFSVSRDLLPFFGCSCQFCQEKFQTSFGYSLPLFEKRGKEIVDYLQFRADTITSLVTGLAQLVHRKGKEFGINLYDPTLRLDVLYYGYSLAAIEPLLDYYLVENHSLPTTQRNNSHLSTLLSSTKKPVFVVSYKDGIGYESQYNQADINAIFSEARVRNYQPCLKTSEFTTDGVWHALRLEDLSTPSLTIDHKQSEYTALVATKSTLPQRIAINLFSRHIFSLLEKSQTNKTLAGIAHITGLYQQEVRKPRVTSLNS